MLKLFQHVGIYHSCHLHIHPEDGDSSVYQNVETTLACDMTKSQRLKLCEGMYAVYNV